MKIQLESDYIGVETEQFVKDVEVEISEKGIYICLDVRDYEEPEGEFLSFRVQHSVPWHPLIEEALIELWEAARYGPDGPVDIDDVREMRDEWIATLEKLIEQLRMLTRLKEAA